LISTPELISQMQSVLAAEESEMMQAAIWNGGFYLWRMGICPELNSSLLKAKRLLTSGQVAEKLQQLSHVIQVLVNQLQEIC